MPLEDYIDTIKNMSKKKQEKLMKFFRTVTIPELAQRLIDYTGPSQFYTMGKLAFQRMALYMDYDDIMNLLYVDPLLEEFIDDDFWKLYYPVDMSTRARVIEIEYLEDDDLFSNNIQPDVLQRLTNSANEQNAAHGDVIKIAGEDYLLFIYDRNSGIIPLEYAFNYDYGSLPRQFVVSNKFHPDYFTDAIRDHLVWLGSNIITDDVLNKVKKITKSEYRKYKFYVDEVEAEDGLSQFYIMYIGPYVVIICLIKNYKYDNMSANDVNAAKALVTHYKNATPVTVDTGKDGIGQYHVKTMTGSFYTSHKPDFRQIILMRVRY